MKKRTRGMRPPSHLRRGQAGTDELDRVFDVVARYFSLLSDRTRLKILNAICNAEQPVGAIVAMTGASQTNVSRHLALLRHAGVVSRRKDRNTVFYKVTDRVFADVCRTVCVYIAGGIDARAPLREDLLAFVEQH